MSLADELIGGFVDADCPNCSYVLEFQLVDALAQVWRWCPCCRYRIRLMDVGGSVYKAREDIDRAMKGLEQQFKDLFS